MSAITLTAQLEAAISKVIVHLESASAKVAELQKNPACEPQTLVVHTRAMHVQVAALRTLTALKKELIRLENPSAFAARNQNKGPAAPSLQPPDSDFAALSVSSSPPPIPKPPTPNHQPPSPIPQLPTPTRRHSSSVLSFLNMGSPSAMTGVRLTASATRSSHS